MKKIIKNQISIYFSPTPIFWRKIGDSLLGVSTFITGLAIASDYKEIAIGSLIIGSVGKFLTNFFKKEDTE